MSLDKARVLIAGIGGFGSRHLQAMAKLPPTVVLWAVDPSDDARQLARARYDEVRTGDSPDVQYLKSLSDAGGEIDVAILATRAEMRMAALKELCDHGGARYLVFEKVVFQSNDEFNAAAGLLEGRNSRCWANFPRRMWDVFKDLNNLMRPDEPFHLVISGATNIGSNGVHYADLFQFLAGGGALSLTQSDLLLKVYESNRKGCAEFSGTLSFKAGPAQTAVIIGYQETDMPDSVSVFTRDLRFHYDQATSLARLALRENDWDWRTIDYGSMPLQSDLSRTIVADLMADGDCGLTPLAEAHASHAVMFEAFNAHLEALGMRDGDRCPIT